MSGSGRRAHVRTARRRRSGLRTAWLGQDAFKAVIAHNYGYRCAITGDKVRPVVEAAHVLPVAKGGQHRPAAAQ